MSQAEKYLALFLAESREHIQQCNAHLLAWERNPEADEPVLGLFRSIHTLKGMAAAMGFARLANLAHAFEHVLSAARDGAVPAGLELVEVSFRVVDRLEHGIGLAAEGRDDVIQDEDLAAELTGFARPATGTFPVPALRPDRAPAPEPGGVVVRVTLQAGAALPGARAALVLQRATRLGTVSAVTPPAESWGSEAFGGSFACRIATVLSDEEIRRQLNAVGDVAEVAVLRGAAGAAAETPRRQVRVELDRLDRLVRLSGELSVAAPRLAARLAALRDPELETQGHQLERLVAELQEQVLRARMAPVGEVFDRFPRAMRDLARQLDKRVRLEVEGAEIELDRAILDRLPDVLLHLLRNAIDHGIELPADRKRAGKPPEGMVGLRARRERNAVLITVEDDGRGIDASAVRARARDLGLTAEAEIPDLLRVLSHQGLSTKREVTDISGRGVGVSAVLHRIRAMGGAAELRSAPGQGTAVVLRLPLTLAVVPALLVRVDQERYALPLGFVAETTRIPAEAAGGSMDYRGARLPVIRLGPRRGSEARPGVILEVAGRQGALVVDTLLGQEDVVVHPVDAPRGVPDWVNGATILADGGTALMVDPTVMV